MPFNPLNNSLKSNVHQSYSAAIMESKDRRAAHSERQQALHPSDRRKGKNGGGGRAFKPRDPRNQYTVDDFSVDESDTPYDEPDYPVSPGPIDIAGSSDVGASLPRTVPRVELELAAIIKPGRKKKGVAGDFEMIPRPAEVLALPIDEGFEDEDDGWEDVSSSHEPGNAALKLPSGAVSYAAALSATR